MKTPQYQPNAVNFAGRTQSRTCTTISTSLPCVLHHSLRQALAAGVWAPVVRATKRVFEVNEGVFDICALS